MGLVAYVLQTIREDLKVHRVSIIHSAAWYLVDFQTGRKLDSYLAVHGHPMEKPTPEVKPATTAHLLAGSSAGLISAFTLQPFDLLKTRLQQQQRANVAYRSSISKELKKLAKVKDLWRGALPSTLRTSVGAGLYFTILSQTRTYVARLRSGQANLPQSQTSILPKLSAMDNLASGFVVRAVVGFITMPITIIKTRFELNMYNYNSMYEGVEGIYLDGQTKGSLRNFFKGTIATLARDCPYAGLYVLFYESFKNEFVPLTLSFIGQSDQRSNSTLVNSSAAVAASLFATTITAPFDAIKTRLQLASNPAGGNSIMAVTRQLLQEEGGVRNLFRGLSLRFGRKGLSAAISWCVYEELLKSGRVQKLLH